MYLIVTRTFPPEVGGMQNLMWGLARSLSKINLIKVIADYKEGHEEFDNSVSFELPRDPNLKDYEWGKGHHQVDVVHPAISIGNSEVGMSSVFCIPGWFTRHCTNLAISKAHAQRKYHVGRDTRNEEDDHYGIYSDKSNRLNDAAVWSKMADLVNASLGGKVFNIIVEKLNES